MTHAVLLLQGVVSSAAELMKYISCHGNSHFPDQLLKEEKQKNWNYSGSDADFSGELCESLNVYISVSLHVQ